MARAVQRGDPLSPYIFVLAMDLLSRKLSKTLREGSIQGVLVPPINQQGLHSIYADDIAIVFWAKPHYIVKIKEVMDWFARAIGVFVFWSKTKSAFISSRPMPAYLQELRHTQFVHKEAPNPEETTKNPQFFPMEELIAMNPARDS
jgi:hypothetical protein